MHNEIRQWISCVKSQNPEYFDGVSVLDVGSLDINGTNRWLFSSSCRYIGIDIAKGSNVDVVMPLHEYEKIVPPSIFDTIVSTDCLEHGKYWHDTLRSMIVLLKPSGLLVFTCAGEGHYEHGTARPNPSANPYTKHAQTRWGRDWIPSFWA